MIVAGFGFRAAATGASLEEAFDMAAAGRDVLALATSEDKAMAAVFRTFAKAQSRPIAAIDAARLRAQETTTQSAQSRAHRGVGSVAEAAALAAAGPGARLLAPRVVSADGTATCALAKSSGDRDE